MSCVVEVLILSLSLSLIILLKIVNKNPPPILNIYQRPNGFFWLKVAFVFTTLKIRQVSNKLKKLIGGKRSQDEFLQSLDKPQPLSIHEFAIDGVYFNGASKSGDYFVLGSARRKNRLIDGFFYLSLNDSNLGLLESPKLPGTSLYQTENDNDFQVDGIKLSPLVAMKKWRIQYNGKMRKAEDRTQEVHVLIEAEWSSNLPYFNFDTDMDPWLMAQTIAKERWSRKYFENLKSNHQIHYEQFGELNGVAIIDGKKYELDLNTLRDHSFGDHRYWSNFHRYGLHFVSCENGDRIHLGVVSMPISFSAVTIGYVFKAMDKRIYPITSCDFQLYQHGEGGSPPKDYAFTFTAGDGEYTLQTKVLKSPHFYISKDWECKVYESLCTFDVNGLKGWGAAEFQYRNVNGKKVSDYNKMCNRIIYA